MKEQAITYLEHIQGEALPPQLSKADFLQNGLKEVINKENFIKHLESKQDSFRRLNALSLVEPTLKKWDLELTHEGRKTYIKSFQSHKNLYYVLVTEQDDKLLITGIPTHKKREILRQVNNANSIRGRSIGTFNSLPEFQQIDKAPTPQPNSTTNKTHIQDDMQNETSQIIELAKKDLLKNGNYNLDELMDKVG
ncbi:hypothetical protein CCZ01_09785, partial [Helicobacter monodelphidis]